MNDNTFFLDNKIIDHNIIYHYFDDKKNAFHIYSVNIAQISDLRTMVIFNKINKFLKTAPNPSSDSIKKKNVNFLMDNMHKIILKYQLENMDIEEGTKKLIVDSNIILDLRELCIDDVKIDYVYLRKYTPKTKSRNDEIFKSRFEPCNFRYFDIIFEEESIESYQKRIKEIMNYLNKVTENQKCVILLQEINPILNAYDVLQFYPEFSIIDPIFGHLMKYNHGKINEKIFSKSFNVLLTKNFNHRIKKMENDKIIDFFSFKGNEKQKNDFQNIKYYLPKFKLYLYNIHSFLFSNKKIITVMETFFIQEMKTMEKVLIIGDLNFKFTNIYLEEFKDLLDKHSIKYELFSLPFSGSTYEGKLYIQ